MKRFSELLFRAMDDTIRQVFGKATSELIYTIMERHVSLKREEIAENIEAFHTYLEKLLGSEQAQIIQATSIKRLCFKLQREYEEVETYFSVLDELHEIKFKLLVSPSKQEGSVCN